VGARGTLALSKPRAWITPDSLPASERCVQISVPDDLDFFSMLKGALVDLLDPENYEEIGDLTPQECADYWLGWYYALTWPDC
jgi:hypothetical protein